ncbi:hypothetical protein N7330_19235 [Comamonas aquatica]|uniref:Uncharacterized protein n=1 Tax=Comamonas aquatica TaxID=225991 RepID=A0AA42HV80_9BURK|nr:hypothetical protein [Comamonas aquatica]MDH0365154.1 hypothetical protein [Comamonas aquatica]
MDDAIHQSVGHRLVVKRVMPNFQRELAGEQDGALANFVINQLQQVVL